MTARSVQLDLGPADVHTAGAAGGATAEDHAAVVKRITAAIPPAGQSTAMAKPSAADALMKRRKARADARKKPAVKDATTPDGRSRVAGSLHVRADIAPGGALHVRHHMADGEATVFLPARPIYTDSDGS